MRGQDLFTISGTGESPSALQGNAQQCGSDGGGYGNNRIDGMARHLGGILFYFASTVEGFGGT